MEQRNSAHKTELFDACESSEGDESDSDPDYVDSDGNEVSEADDGSRGALSTETKRSTINVSKNSGFSTPKTLNEAGSSKTSVMEATCDDLEPLVHFRGDELGSPNRAEETAIKRSRWNISDPLKWKKNQVKAQRMIPTKAPLPLADHSKCLFNCTENFLPEHRELICFNYWNLDSFKRKKDFILGMTSSKETGKRQVSNNNSKFRISYFLMKNGVKVRVCSNFFQKTLDISTEEICSAFIKQDCYESFEGGNKKDKQLPASEEMLQVEANEKSLPETKCREDLESKRTQLADKRTAEPGVVNEMDTDEPMTYTHTADTSQGATVKQKPYRRRGEVISKTPLPLADHSKCLFKCTENFLSADREQICFDYWKLDSYKRKKDFILSMISSKEPERRQVSNINSKFRSNSKSYFFMKNGLMVRVCSTFFQKTLNISNGPISSAFNGRGCNGSFEGMDKRGRKPSANKTPEEQVNKVKAHIESFPTTDSHYGLNSSRRKYVDSTLTVSKMYSLYRDMCIKDGSIPVHSVTYQRIFCNNYDCSFFKTA